MNFERNLKDFTRVLCSGGRPLSLRDEGSEGKGGAGQRRARGHREPGRRGKEAEGGRRGVRGKEGEEHRQRNRSVQKKTYIKRRSFITYLVTNGRWIIKYKKE